jgi:hypothetical protein
MRTTAVRARGLTPLGRRQRDPTALGQCTSCCAAAVQAERTFNHVKLRPGRTQLLILAGETGDCSDSSGTLVSPAKASSHVALDEQNLNKFNDRSVFVIWIAIDLRRQHQAL